jgi:hypothetical protein
MINNDPNIKSRRPLETLQSDLESASNKSPRLQRCRRGKN